MHKIPRAAYGYDKSGQPIPRSDVDTVATTAFLVTRADASPRMVSEALGAIYEEGLRAKQPDLILARDAIEYRHSMRFHPAARDYYEPWEVGHVATVVEALAGSYELLFAFCAGLYLLWQIRSRRAEKRRLEEMKAQKERLDHFLQRTMDIEHAQMNVTDVSRLNEFLHEVTLTKSEALEELTHEDLRSDRTFSIFLMQCANLISKIQLKIITYSAREMANGDSSE
jgi:hypothetical protein